MIFMVLSGRDNQVDRDDIAYFDRIEDARQWRAWRMKNHPELTVWLVQLETTNDKPNKRR